ncbi:MAG: hypothetical protein NTV60_00070 [Candidatus Kaiserbacteria bacterium]|nr:hypothetical protein [Candidatus Kaiserbacteria bacterium]
MANDIQRKDLYQTLGNIKKVEQWLQVGERLNLRVCRGGKHPSTIRNPQMPDDNGRASLITVIPNDLHRIMNQKIFKEFFRFGIPEDEIWKALGML